MNYSYGMYNLWLRYVEKLSVEALFECYMHSSKSSPSCDSDDDDADIATGHRRFNIWFRGMVYTFYGPVWSRMLSAEEDSQISRHIDPTVLADFVKVIEL